MAIIVKNDMSLQNLCEIFNLGGEEQAVWLIDHGVEIKLAPMNVGFVHNGVVLSKAAVKLESLKMIQDGQLAHASVEVVKSKILTAINQAYKTFAIENEGGAGYPIQEPKGYEIKKQSVPLEKMWEGVFDMGKTFDEVLSVKKTAKEMLEDSNAVKAKEMLEDVNAVMAMELANDNLYAEPSAKKVPLAKATKLHQPVKGTDESSKYFCIALHPEFNVAVRIKNNYQVSIRVEGIEASMSKYSGKFKAAGLNQGSEHHYSIHLQAGSKGTALKCVGAVLFGMGISFLAVSTRVGKLIGG